MLKLLIINYIILIFSKLTKKEVYMHFPNQIGRRITGLVFLIIAIISLILHTSNYSHQVPVVDIVANIWLLSTLLVKILMMIGHRYKIINILSILSFSIIFAIVIIQCTPSPHSPSKINTLKITFELLFVFGGTFCDLFDLGTDVPNKVGYAPNISSTD
jgi:hypothetical protein